MTNYVEFFRKFKKNYYPSPKEIISREYDADSAFEITFVTLKLEKKDTIGFADDLDHVKTQLKSIVRRMISKVNRIPLADTQIANTDKSQLWDIQEEDQMIINAENEIEQILDENLNATKQCVDVYDEFLFLLHED